MRDYAVNAFSLHSDLADGLVEELSRSFSPVLFARFAARPCYTAFIHQLWAGGWRDLFRAYPVLDRLLTRTLSLKAEEARELTERLEIDLPHMRSTFGSEFDRVVSIRSGMSDPHHGLRSVKLLEFACGSRLVYKPKDLALDVKWTSVLKWLNTHHSIQLTSAKVLNRGTHGWTEFVPHSPAQDGSGIHRFYRRAGALLAMLYAVRGADCHFENVIACGEHPVLIDTETLVQPELVLDDTRAVGSVSESGLLPCRETAGRGEVAFSGGLDDAGRLSTATRPWWENVNTDRMTFGGRSRVEFSSANVPQVDGLPVCTHLHMEDVVAGFGETYRLLLTHRAELLSATGPLAAFRNASTRVILRNTRAYGVMLRCATLPQFLVAEQTYHARIQSLVARAGKTGIEHPDQISEFEVEALAGGDVPVFAASTNSTSLFANSGREIPGVLAAAGYDAVLDRIRGLSVGDMKSQVETIRAAFRVVQEFCVVQEKEKTSDRFQAAAAPV